MNRTRSVPPPDLDDFLRGEHRRLVSAIDLLVGDLHTAEDLAQEAMIRVAARWPKVRQMSSPGGWLHRVGVNLAISHLRRRGSQRTAEARLSARGTGTVHHDPDVGASVDLREALMALPVPERTVLVSRYLLGTSVEATAGLIGRSPTAVRSLTQRALRHLREEFDVDLGADMAAKEFTDGR